MQLLIQNTHNGILQPGQIDVLITVKESRLISCGRLISLIYRIAAIQLYLSKPYGIGSSTA